jgi:hypothetical protein
MHALFLPTAACAIPALPRKIHGLRRIDPLLLRYLSYVAIRKNRVLNDSYAYFLPFVGTKGSGLLGRSCVDRTLIASSSFGQGDRRATCFQSL